MKILITGGTGLLGKSLIETAGSDHIILATYLIDRGLKDTNSVGYTHLDVRDADGCRKIFKNFKPDVTVHTAGVGSPDYAQTHKEITRRTNIDGMMNIIKCCELCGSRFIYTSSNAIYRGDMAPYSEDDEAGPINFYGEIKLEGERLAKTANIPTAIIRPILMYGWNHPLCRPNIVTFSIARLRKGEKVYSYEDVFVTPILAKDCARAVWRMIDKGIYDLFNIGGPDRVSIFELVRTAAGVFGLNPDLVVPVRQGFFNEFVKRPSDTSYKIGKMRGLLNMIPLSPSEGLISMMEEGEPA